MKKLFVLSLLCLLTLGASAQEHMKFLGKSLNMNLSQFTAQMQKLGYERDIEASKSFDDCRVFDGEYGDYLADLYVYYDSTTKLVYRAKAVIPFGTEETAASVTDDFITEILESGEYDGKYDDDPDERGNPNLRLFVRSSVDRDEFIGIVDVFMTCDEDEDEYDVHVDFIDLANARKAGEDF